MSEITRFLRQVPAIFLAPGLVVGAMGVVLLVLGALLGHVGGAEKITDYDSIDQAESAVGFDVVLPVYFPGYLSWPPARIQGQLEPLPMVQMVFLSSEGEQEALLVRQVASDSEEPSSDIPWVASVESEISIVVNDAGGVLTTGNKVDGSSVAAARWAVDGYHFTVVTVQPVKELIMLAESMHAP